CHCAAARPGAVVLPLVQLPVLERASPAPCPPSSSPVTRRDVTRADREEAVRFAGGLARPTSSGRRHFRFRRAANIFSAGCKVRISDRQYLREGWSSTQGKRPPATDVSVAPDAALLTSEGVITMMPSIITCPNCRKHLKVKRPLLANRSVPCPVCRQQ